MARNVPKRENVTSAILLVALGLFVASIALEGFFRHSKAQVSRPAKPSAAAYPLPSGWTLTGNWEVYPNGRLYEKIDGRETLFQQYGVVKMEFASVAGNGKQFDVYIYQMNDTDAALGVYLAQTPSEFSEIDIGAAMADLSGGQIRAFQGKTYLEIQPQEKNTDSRLTKDLAKSVLAGIPREKAGAGSILDALPKSGRVKGSLVLNKDNTYGLKSLNNAFSASYDINGQSFDCLVKKARPNEGEKALRKVRDEIKEFDGRIIEFQPNKLSADMMGKTLIVFRDGDILRGACGESPPAELEKLLTALRNPTNAGK